MGRRKKETLISYIAILSTSYVKRTDYEQAQVIYSNNLEHKAPISSHKAKARLVKESELDQEDEDLPD